MPGNEGINDKRCPTNLHCHVRHDTSRLSLDDAFHNVLHMIATCCNHATLALHYLPVRIASEKHRILRQCFDGIVRTDCEHGRERELQLLTCHGLERHAEIEGSDRELGDLLEGFNLYAFVH